MKHQARQSRRALLGLTVLVGLAGCDGIFDVNNPNNVLQEDLDKPTAVDALLNGTAARIMNADAALIRSHALLSDETVWIGSLNDRGDLGFGNFNPRSSDVDNHFMDFAEARWLADQTIESLRRFDGEGTLRSRQDLARAYFYGGLVYTRIGEWYEDFVMSDRRSAVAPVGPNNMPQVLDQAIQYYDQALAIATAPALRQEILANRARARYVRALRPKLGGGADPLVNDAGAVADAEAFLATGAAGNWTFQWTFIGGTTGEHTFGNDVNSRLEQRFSNSYVVPTADGRRTASVRLQDPISGQIDPVLQRTITTFHAAVNHPAQVVTSAREMRLILAEAALAAGNTAGFAEHINAIRALDALPAYTGQIPALEMLIHMRRVNLFIQGRRLFDQYRFGTPTAEWIPTAQARTRPGTLMPIGYTELISNCHIAGSC